MIRICGDSTIDLTDEIKNQFNIITKPLTITLGANEYLDGETITADDILKYVDETKQLPKTSCINENGYTEFFRELTKNGDSVIYFNISSDMSACHNNAINASKNIENVYVIDSKNLSSGTGLLVLYAKDLVNKGKYTAKEIYDMCMKRIDDVHASFVIENLKLLYKGGRCSMISMLGANLLKLRPCIEVKNGKMGVIKKYRGKMELLIPEYISDMIKLYPNIDSSRCFITYTTATDEMLTNAVNKVKSLNLFKEILITRASGTITSHCGSHTLGILFMTK